MLIGGESGAERLRARLPKWAQRTGIKPLRHKPTDDVAKIKKLNRELIWRLGESAGTPTERLLDKDAARLALNFLGDMLGRDMPGAEDIEAGHGPKKAYMIGVTEVSGLRTGVDENGPYHTVFGARVFLSADGRLRAPVEESFEPNSFEPFEFPFEEGFNTDVVQEGFTSGRLESHAGESRFYPMSLNATLGRLATADS